MPTVSKISFGDASFQKIHPKERHRERPLLSSISEMTDEEIIEASFRKANKNAEQSKAACVLKNGPLMFLAATSIVCGALSKGKLSDKAVSSIKTLAAGSAIFALAKPVDNVVNAAMDSFSKDDKKQEKNPVLSFALNVAALGAASALAIKGAKFGAGKLAGKFAPTANAIKENLIKGADIIDSSKFGKFTEKASKAAIDFSNKFPRLAALTGGLAGIFPSLAFVGGSIELADKISKSRDKEAFSNINKLVLCREFAKTAVDKNSEE